MAVTSRSAGPMSMGHAMIGPASWRNNTVQGIKLSQNAVNVSDKNCQIGRASDPLPNLRNVVAELSNDEAHGYFRQTRAVVAQLRDCLMNTNEEIKSLTRTKESLEKAIENVRKDFLLNQDCQDQRKSRPAQERENDGADDLLNAERMQLSNLKRMLETKLQLVHQQIQTLDKARKKLANVISERSRVLDLVCHALPKGNLRASTTLARNSFASHSRVSMSADFDRTGSRSGEQNPDPLGPFTPEAESALQEARDAQNRSAMLRKDGGETVGRADKIHQSLQNAVNSGMTRKISETVGLKQQLEMASADNRHAINRAHRFYDQTEKAWGYSRGPLYSGDMGFCEKLDRPIIRTFQRHPGTDLPEAQEIVKGGDGLLQSLQSTSRSIGMMKLAQLKLKDDLRSKKAAIAVDSSIVRMRRKKADHHWAMGQAF